MTQPIKPHEVNPGEGIPDEVIAVFNGLINRYWSGRQAVIKQQEAVRMIASSLDISTSEVYERRLLNVEEAFRRAGWVVVYDKPGYNEDYPATFTFSKR